VVGLSREERIAGAVAIVRQAMARVSMLSEETSPEAGRTLRAVAERLYSERRRRDACFPPGLFGEPAWDLLLALLIADDDDRDLTISEACSAARLDEEAGLAVIETLVAAGMVRYVPARQDRRVNAVALTEAATGRLTNYLTDLI
jgi:DNA-binding MarR family transcriptional regulator